MLDIDRVSEIELRREELLNRQPAQLSDEELVYAAVWGPRRGGGWIQSLHEELLHRLQLASQPECSRCQGVLLKPSGLCADCASVDRTEDRNLRERLSQ